MQWVGETLKKISAQYRTTVALMLLAGMLSGCGNDNFPVKQSTLAGEGNKAVVSNNTGVPGGPLAAEPKAEPFQNNDSGSPQGTTTAQTGGDTSSSLQGRAGSATSDASAVRGVENVSGPFGPFPSESDTVNRSRSNAAAPPPPEPPETPRGPFGPFPTSP